MMLQVYLLFLMLYLLIPLRKKCSRRELISSYAGVTLVKILDLLQDATEYKKRVRQQAKNYPSII